MRKHLDPKLFGLHPKTVLEKIDSDTLAIIIDRKSRIIMADGRKILEKAKVISKEMPGKEVLLKTSTPICSKTMKYFKNNGLKVISN
jgi:hypothetical protein